MERYSQLLGLGSAKCGGMVLTVDRQRLWGKTYFSATLSYSNSTLICLEPNLCVVCKRSATISLTLRIASTLNLKNFFFWISLPLDVRQWLYMFVYFKHALKIWAVRNTRVFFTMVATGRFWSRILLHILTAHLHSLYIRLCGSIPCGY